MDGTLLDSEKIWDVALHELAASLGGRLSNRARIAMVGSNLRHSVGMLHDDLGIAATDADPARSAEFLTTRTTELFRTELTWRPGARELLVAVRESGVPAALVTSTHRALTEVALDTLGRENFAASVCGDEVDEPKPAAESYLRAADLLGVQAGRCVAVEDSPTGVAAAQAAGCAVLAVPSEVPLDPAPGRTVRDSLVGLTVADLAALFAGTDPLTGRLADILPAAAALLGVPDAVDRLGLCARLGPRSTVAVVLVDGLGADLLPLLAHRAPLLAAAAADAQRLHCAFPSTTPTSLVTLGTGAAPGEHGVLGFTLAVPGTDRLVTHVSWRDDPPPRQWQPLPTWFDHVAAAGLESRVVLPGLFAGSGLSDAAYRGARFCAFDEGEDAGVRLLRELAGGPGLYYGYTAALDTAAHWFGVGSTQWLDAAAEVDAYLSTVVAGLPDDAVLLVTADHGGLDIDPQLRWDVGTQPALAAGVRLVAGEVRVRYLHVVDGAVADVVASWQAELGEHADVLHRDEAVDAGLFGTVAAAHRARIGDVVVVCRGATGVFATGYEPDEVGKLVGVHGGLTEAETAIPLFVFDGASRGSVSTAG